MMKIKKFKNGNFNIKADNKGAVLLHDLYDSASLDFAPAGDEQTASNYHMAYPMFSHFTGMLYLPTSIDCERYAQGKSVKLVGRPLTDEERTELGYM